MDKQPFKNSTLFKKQVSITPEKLLEQLTQVNKINTKLTETNKVLERRLRKLELLVNQLILESKTTRRKQKYIKENLQTVQNSVDSLTRRNTK